MGLHIRENVAKFLSERPGIDFTALQIAEWFLKSFPAECEAKKARTTIKTDDKL